MPGNSAQNEWARKILHHAVTRHAAGDLALAEQSYRILLDSQPDHAEALAGLGVVVGQMGQHDVAAKHLAKACALEPSNTIFHHNYGEALRQHGQLPLAEAALRRALELDPKFLPALESLIAIVQAAHAHALATRDGKRAEMLAGELARLANNQGNVLLANLDPLRAISSYRYSISIRADYAIAWSNLGNVLREMGRLSEAEVACRQAITLDPDFGAAWNNLGNALLELRRFDEASSCYDRALAKDPAFPEALHNRGSGSLMNQLYLPEISDAEVAHSHRAWGAAFPLPEGRRWRNSRDPDRVIRIGYLSPDFREHAMRPFIEPMLARHDKSQVEIICYAQNSYADEHTRRLMQYGHRWKWIHESNDAALAAEIERDGIDILVDCAGHTRGTRLVALAGKPAPILMSWLGYLCTTGLPAMDYRLTDEWVDPPGLTESQHTEKLLRVPGGMMAWRPHEILADVNDLPYLSQGYVTLGSLNNVQKINPVVVERWAQILRAMPQARLLLQSKLLVDPQMVGRIRGMFEAFGIRPGRIELRQAIPNFLKMYHEIDIALDTWPYGGGATTCDALWMGVPVVTLAGGRPAGRLSTSILHQIGRHEWITASAKAYVDKTIELAGKPDALNFIRRGLRAQMRGSTLCDEAGFVQRLEKIYRFAWRQWLNEAVTSRLGRR
jgi:predicted O-linked N-acetylglucosamine transferase (SPINDLY family)